MKAILLFIPIMQLISNYFMVDSKLNSSQNLGPKLTKRTTSTTFDANICTSDSSIRMTLNISGDTAYYSLLKIQPNPALKGYLIDYTENLMDSFNINVPVDGNTYWFIPFDKNVSPLIISGSGGVFCQCLGPSGAPGTGTCCQPAYVNGKYYCEPCLSLPCDGCCDLLYMASTNWFGAGVMVQANVVVYD